MKRRLLISWLAATAASINVIRAPAKAAQWSYKFATNNPMGDPRNYDAVIMMNNVKRLTGGRLEIKLFPNSILGGDTDMLTQVRVGALEFMTISPGILSNVVPVAAIEGVPFVWKDVKIALQAYDGALGDYVRSEVEAKGLVVFKTMLDNGFRNITNRAFPIRTVNDLAGLKIRIPPGRLWVDSFKTLGAIGMPMNFAEVYTALQTHILDAQENPFQVIEVWRIYEVQKYLSITNHMWGGFFVIANPDAWKALPLDVREIVSKEMDAYALRQRKDNALLNGSLADKLRRQGMIFNTCDVEGFKVKLKDNYAKWKSEFGATAWELLERYTGKLV
jgi:TRAP-type transport system periplasmic protein